MSDCEFENVWPKTEDEFLTLLRERVARYSGGSGFAAEIGIITGTATEDGKDGYSEGAYLMRDVAVLAFNYASHIAGASGFQASIAAMEAYGSIVGIENFGVVQMDDLLYPQYDLRAKLEGWIRDHTPRLQAKARELLVEKNDIVGPRVREWWTYLATGGRP